MSIDEVIKRSKIQPNNLVALYMYGSRVYGTFRKSSDYDFIAVVKKREHEQFSDNVININFFDVDAHQHRLNEHEISALETFFLKPEFILLEKKKFVFQLNHSKLRHAISAKSSNSWVKAKKKLTVPESYDLDLGRKSLFHSIRIIDFGIQIAKTGKINDYSSCNPIFKEIMDCYNWQEMYDEFKQHYNMCCTMFRLECPK